jgi:hypothetical protein
MALAINKFIPQIAARQPELTVRRLVLHKGEVFSGPRTSVAVRVISGAAWVSWNQEDHVLEKGGEAVFPESSDFPVISAINDPLTLVEVYSR